MTFGELILIPVVVEPPLRLAETKAIKARNAYEGQICYFAQLLDPMGWMHPTWYVSFVSPTTCYIVRFDDGYVTVVEPEQRLWVSRDEIPL